MIAPFRLLLVTLLLFLASFESLHAQRSFGGKPHSFFSSKSVKEVPIKTFPKVDIYSLYAQDQLRVNNGKSLRVGIRMPIGLWNSECGLIETLPNGDKLWRMGFISDGAFSMSISFKSFNIPVEAELFIYNKKKDFILGKFTTENTLQDSVFYTQQIPGDTLYVEYYEPKNAEFKGSFFIENIGHAYRDFFAKKYNPVPDSSDFCQINVICSEGDNWRDQIRSVAYYTIESSDAIYMCSGALANNTNLDNKQYFLSACHCQEDLEVLGWVFYFNYQTNTCSGNTGVLNNSVTGASIVAKRDRNVGSDFLLLEIEEPIPESYNVYYAGWDKTTTPNAGACVHHPSGDWKKISIPKNVSSADTRFWGVRWISENQGKGTTEPGSSGSPLFNANKRIIGQLFGGSSTCDSNWLEDYYGKMSVSFSSSRNIGTSLYHWLDPISSNVQYLDGKNASELAIAEPPMTANEILLFPNPAKDKITLQVSNLTKKGRCTVFTLSGEKVFETDLLSKSTTFDFSFLKSGSYLMRLHLENTTKSISFTILR